MTPKKGEKRQDGAQDAGSSGEKRQRGGRPPLFNPERAKTILAAVRLGMSEARAATLAGVDPKTASKWKTRGGREKSGPYFEFFEALRLAGPKFEFSNLAVINAAKTRDWRAAKALLEMKMPETYGRKHLRISGDPEGGGPVKTETRLLSPEEKADRAKRAQRVLDALGGMGKAE